jgi:hypothetical protein
MRPLSILSPLQKCGDAMNQSSEPKQLAAEVISARRERVREVGRRQAKVQLAKMLDQISAEYLKSKRRSPAVTLRGQRDIG